MGLFTKDAQTRLTDTLKCIEDLPPPKAKYDLLEQWVYSGGLYTPASISAALSLDVGAWGKLTGGTESRRLIRAAILARLAAEAPANINVTSLWAAAYKSQSDSALTAEILMQINKLQNPVPLPKVTGVSPKPQSYGLGLTALTSAKAGLKSVTTTAPVNLKAAPLPPGETATTGAKKSYFEDVSRTHVVLSGHGSWPYDASTGTWPKTTLKKNQEFRCYIEHYYPLMNDAGKLVDNRRFPAPTDTYAGGSQVCDYTLHHKDTLTLLNNSVGDIHFRTVSTDTRLSTFLAMDEYEAAVFHWGACRVEFNASGQVRCPTHSAWEDYGGGAPTPCVLR